MVAKVYPLLCSAPDRLGRWEARHDIVRRQELVLGKELGFGERDCGQERTPFKDQAQACAFQTTVVR